MKQPKRLNRAQKIIVSAANLDPDDWALVAEKEVYLEIINKKTGTRRSIDRYALPRKGGRR